MTEFLVVRLYCSNRIDRIVPVITPGMEFKHLAQAVQDAYNDFKRDVDSDSRQVTLFFHTFRQYQIKPDQKDCTPPCKRRKGKQAQVKLI